MLHAIFKDAFCMNLLCRLLNCSLINQGKLAEIRPASECVGALLVSAGSGHTEQTEI